MCPSLKDHITTLLQPLIYELIATFCRFSRFTSACQEDPALLVLDRHEVGWNLDIDNVGSVGVRAEVVHEQIVRIVDKEMQSVNHFSIVAYQRHLYCLLHDLGYGLLGALLLL